MEKLSWHPGAVTDLSDGPSRRSAADLFAQLCVAAVRGLPFGLSSLVAPSFVGFALINGFTFSVDMLLLTLLHGVLGLAVWLAISLSYASAFALSFVLNRAFNFRSHAPVGRQAGMFAGVVAINYVAIILGIGGGLAVAGLEYHFARIIAGICEGLFIYCAMRWVVFARRAEPRVCSVI